MTVLRPFFVVSYTVSNCRRRSENGVSDRLRSFTIRWNTTVIRLKTVVYGRVLLTWVSRKKNLIYDISRNIDKLHERDTTAYFKNKNRIFHNSSKICIISKKREHCYYLRLKWKVKEKFVEIQTVHSAKFLRDLIVFEYYVFVEHLFLLSFCLLMYSVSHVLQLIFFVSASNIRRGNSESQVIVIRPPISFAYRYPFNFMNGVYELFPYNYLFSDDVNFIQYYLTTLKKSYK